MNVFDNVHLKLMARDYLQKCSELLREVLTDSDPVAGEHSRCYWGDAYMAAVRLSGGM